MWGRVWSRFEFLVPLWIGRRPGSVTIFDYRPTLMMFLTTAGLVILAVSFVLTYLNFGTTMTPALLVIGAPMAVCLFFVFRGTIREIYYFDATTDRYVFTRRFIHRKEVIEGAMSQFKGAYVKTVQNEDSEGYSVVLNQEGMFLTGVSEQTLREEVPLFNSFERETRIANAISGVLASKS